ncbi:MAG: response regulator [Luteibaculum sp.]
MKVLIVEDDETYKFILDNLLPDFNQEIDLIAAESGEDAIELVNEHMDSLDVIVVDLHLSDGPAWKLLDHISDLKETLNPELIVLTTSVEITGKASTKAKNYDVVREYIPKPISIDLVSKYFVRD